MARPTPTPSTLAALLARAVTGGEDAGADGTEDRILDAAMAEVAEHGTKATTMDDVALTAGVARMTVFRRFGSKSALLERLVLRELRAFLERVDAALDAVPDPADRVAEAFVQCVRIATEHPLVARLVRHEPARTFARLTSGEPSPLEFGRLYVAARIRADIPPGTLREDPDAVADVLVRLAATYVLVPSVAVDLSDEAAAREFARRVLAPLVV
jgi:AcrR family transcriptional regulator